MVNDDSEDAALAANGRSSDAGAPDSPSLFPSDGLVVSGIVTTTIGARVLVPSLSGA